MDDPHFCELCNLIGGYCGDCSACHWDYINISKAAEKALEVENHPSQKDD